MVPAISGERVTIGFKIEDVIHKICLIAFHKGGIFIDLPYYQQTDGLLSKVTLPPGQTHFPEVPIEDKAKVTTHLVKYSHPADGKVHFSQDGKVISTFKYGIFNQSHPINEYNGHLATLKFQGTQHFERIVGEPKGKKHWQVACDFPERGTDSYQVVFSCYTSDDELKKRGYSEITDDIQAGHKLQFPDGRMAEEWFITNPENSLLLIVTAEQVERIPNAIPEDQMSFIGGFDKYVNDGSQSTSFLALVYPIQDLAAKTDKLGLADYMLTSKY